jgi:hypothetical protein
MPGLPHQYAAIGFNPNYISPQWDFKTRNLALITELIRCYKYSLPQVESTGFEKSLRDFNRQCLERYDIGRFSERNVEIELMDYALGSIHRVRGYGK